MAFHLPERAGSIDGKTAWRCEKCNIVATCDDIIWSGEAWLCRKCHEGEKHGSKKK